MKCNIINEIFHRQMTVWMLVCFCVGCSVTNGSDHLTAAPYYSRDEVWFDAPDNMQQLMYSV